jgi:hypothetical protein
MQARGFLLQQIDDWGGELGCQRVINGSAFSVPDFSGRNPSWLYLFSAGFGCLVRAEAAVELSRWRKPPGHASK